MRKVVKKIMKLQFFSLTQYEGKTEKEKEAMEIIGKHIDQLDQTFILI